MKVSYLSDLDRLLVVEAQSHSVKLLSPELHKKEVLDLHSRDLDFRTQFAEGESNFSRKDPAFFVVAAAYNEPEQLVDWRYDNIVDLCMQQ